MDDHLAAVLLVENAALRACRVLFAGDRLKFHQSNLRATLTQVSCLKRHPATAVSAGQRPSEAVAAAAGLSDEKAGASTARISEVSGQPIHERLHELRLRRGAVGDDERRFAQEPRQPRSGTVRFPTNARLLLRPV
jgi:hypothetical protein